MNYRRSITEKHLDTILSILSDREMSADIKQAVCMYYKNGASYSYAAVITGVNERSVSRAVKRIAEIHIKIMDGFAIS